MNNYRIRWMLALLLFSGMLSSCTVKAVGDPDRPITIVHNITLDIKGLEKTATGIEDFVSGESEAVK